MAKRNSGKGAADSAREQSNDELAAGHKVQGDAPAPGYSEVHIKNQPIDIRLKSDGQDEQIDEPGFFWNELKNQDSLSVLVEMILDKAQSANKEEIFELFHHVLPEKDHEEFEMKLNELFDGIAETKLRLNDPESYDKVGSIINEIIGFLGSDDKSSYTFRRLKKFEDEQIDYISNIIKASVKSTTTYYRPRRIELIWNYWMEEGMVTASMNAIARKFENRNVEGVDPLANLSLNPLTSLGQLIFSYIQDPYRLRREQRSLEYQNQYGYALANSGRGAEVRSRFHEALNNLFIRCSEYFRLSDNLTINADPFPVLNALKEVHLILAQGFQNQAGSITARARGEAILEQYILAKDEIKEFLGQRPMVPYKEKWMGSVDAMKERQSWNPSSISYFYDLATYGERIILSIRFIAWSNTDNPAFVKAWANAFRTEIQRYVHSYRAVTGVDLSSETACPIHIRNIIPSVLIQRRLSAARV